jgi:FMN hydrolase / 5-amino-6-(5-phospho-D-ribitylamino)uracil phosphatase
MFFPQNDAASVVLCIHGRLVDAWSQVRVFFATKRVGVEEVARSGMARLARVVPGRSDGGVVLAVTFDFWHTLVRDPAPRVTNERRVAAVRALVDSARADQVPEAMQAAIAEHTRVWRTGLQYGLTRIVPDLAARLDIDVTQHGRLADALVGAPRAEDLEVAPGAIDVLEQLRGARIRLGVISDTGVLTGRELRTYLDHHGLRRFFDVLCFSDEVGVPKPDHRIFRAALDGLGAVPQHAAHVGDLLTTDIAGARAAGMTAVLYTGLTDAPADAGPDAPEPHVRVADLRELPPRLEAFADSVEARPEGVSS